MFRVNDAAHDAPGDGYRNPISTLLGNVVRGALAGRWSGPLPQLGAATVGTMPAPRLPRASLLTTPIAPMLARASDALPAAGDFLFEPKWDGFRAIVFRPSPAGEHREQHHRADQERRLLVGGRAIAASSGRNDRRRRRRQCEAAMKTAREAAAAQSAIEQGWRGRAF